MSESLEDLLRQAKAGNAWAQNAIGCSLAEAGHHVEAEGWFRLAAQQGLPQAKHNIGASFFQAGDVAQARVWFTDAADDEWPDSLYLLGMIHWNAGETDSAIPLLRRGAQLGNAEAQNAMAHIHFEHETEADDIIARQWSELAAAQGVASAQARLGTIYHEGRGTPRDPPRAAAFFSMRRIRGTQAPSWRSVRPCTWAWVLRPIGSKPRTG
jgi:TPR repeat protein